jgi:hypothetical protein
LGFASFKTEVEDVLKDHKKQQKVCYLLFCFDSVLTVQQDREKKTSKLAASGKTTEELIAEQEALFAQSAARFQAQGPP